MINNVKSNNTWERSKRAQYDIISAAKSIADIIRTTLGPKSMQKMLLNTQGIVLTNDGHAILREIEVTHPAAKSMLALSQTQDENVGDGTTSVVIIAGEMLHVSEPFLEKNIHPTMITRAYNTALQVALKTISSMKFSIDETDRTQMLGAIKTCVGTKFSNQFGYLVAELALDAVSIIIPKQNKIRRVIDYKKNIKIEKIPGGVVEECKVLKGVIFNKDVVNPGRMRRKIYKPRIILLDCPLEYKKGENMIDIEMTRDTDFENILKLEEDWIYRICSHISSFKPDVVITEKGLSDLAAHYLQKKGITAIRRIRKTDNNRISRACGASIVHRPDEINESDVGIRAGLFEVCKIGDDYYTLIDDCEDPKACSIVLRGASRDLLDEIERNLIDAICVTRNLVLHPSLLPGGGALEMEINQKLIQDYQQIEGIMHWPYLAVGLALEVIPRTLVQNCGVNVIRSLTILRAKHVMPDFCNWGIEGNHGKIADMKESGILEPTFVKQQLLKTAIESSCLLMRIDQIIEGQ
jgi:T-complex protein 1 subunit gamma